MFGDEFMRQIEPISAYVPYMTVVGNHEQKYNFSHYINRFTMPNTTHNLFYRFIMIFLFVKKIFSFDVGHTHFVVFSTEFYFFYIQYGFEQIKRQWNFLTDDLKVIFLIINLH